MPDGRKGCRQSLCPQPLRPGASGLSPPCSPPPALTDSTAALMPLVVTQVSLQGSARFKVQTNFLADMGRGGDCQRQEWPCGLRVSWVTLTSRHGARASGGEIYRVEGQSLFPEEMHLALPSSLELEKEKEEPGQGAGKGRGRRSWGKINLEKNLF